MNCQAAACLRVLTSFYRFAELIVLHVLCGAGKYDSALSTFFRNVDTRFTPARDIPLGSGHVDIGALKARAVLIDMEEGVVNELLKGPMRDVFDTNQLITSVSGSGTGLSLVVLRGRK